MPAIKEIGPDRLRDWLGDGGELALLDVRDLGPFSRGHLWLAVNLPYARLELRIRRFVPRLTTRLVLCDQDDRLAGRAARVLSRMGYDDISILAGGVGAWQAAGLAVIDGNYVIAHTLGYALKQEHRTPTIDAAALTAKVAAGEDLVIVDTRPLEDYRHATIPGSICVPAAELPRRVRDIAADPKTQVVVHCGGVTRAVLGAHALMLAGAANPVWFLQDGTKGWLAADLTPEPGTIEANGPVSAEARSFAAGAAERMARDHGLTYITPDLLREWRGEADQRTTYVIDVRSLEEFQSGHYPGALSIPGGELAGMTIDHLATRNARLCLVADEDSARAEITAIWMRHLGWPEVAILQDWEALGDLESGLEPSPASLADQTEVPSLSPQELAARQTSQDPLILDFAASPAYEAGHIPGAAWLLRSALPGTIDQFPKADCYVVTSPKGRVSRLIAAEMETMADVPVFALSGGTEAWQSTGLDLLGGMERPLSQVDDIDSVSLAPPDDGSGQNLHARYNSWRRSLFDRYREQGLSELR